MAIYNEDSVQDNRESQLFLAKLAPYMLQKDLRSIETAYEYSKNGHRNTPPRKTGERYFNHPRAAALIAIDEFNVYNWEIIAAILLHDILEESFLMNEERIVLTFGEKVALWVKFATKEKGYKQWYISRFYHQPEWEPLFIKLCDRLHNLRTLFGFNPQEQAKYLIETQNDYLPLAVLLTERLHTEQKWVGKKLQKEIGKLCNIL